MVRACSWGNALFSLEPDEYIQQRTITPVRDDIQGGFHLGVGLEPFVFVDLWSRATTTYMGDLHWSLLAKRLYEESPEEFTGMKSNDPSKF